MLRKSLLVGIRTLTAAVMLMGTAGNAQAFFDDPYVPFCHSGYCGGGDFYLGFGCRKCCNRRSGPVHNGYFGAQRAGSQANRMNYASSTNRKDIPPSPSVIQASSER